VGEEDGTQVNALIEHRHGPVFARNSPALVTPLSGIYQAAQGEGMVASTQQTGGTTLYFPLGCGSREDPASRLQGCALSTGAQSRAISGVLWALAESFLEPTSRQQCCAESCPSLQELSASKSNNKRDLSGQSRRLRAQQDAARRCPSPTGCAQRGERGVDTGTFCPKDQGLVPGHTRWIFTSQGNANLLPVSLFRVWDALSLGADAFRDL